MAHWQIAELVALVRERYAGWEGFQDPAFVEEEEAPKRAAAAQAREWLGKGALRHLLAEGQYDLLFSRLERLAAMTSMLWTAQPRRGDLAILHHDGLNAWALAEQLRALLFDTRPSPDRVAAFGAFCEENGLPNRWPFPTYYLFLVRPHAEMFIKPRVARWFLKFMGMGELYRPRPEAELYERYKKTCHGLLAEMKETYDARDMIDIQSLIWVAYDVSQERAGRLDYRGQIELERPLPLREESAPYEVSGSSGVDPLDHEVSEEAMGPPATLEALAERTLFPEEELTRWLAAIERKGQAIFYGPPGTGKTFVARQLAGFLAAPAGGFVETVQFHPSFDYVDFIEGLRPVTTSTGRLAYEDRPGVFLEFCRRASEVHGLCILVIDEINRANLSRVMGELMYLLEYRRESVRLASGRTLHVPDNVRILGTMNTADRSIALIDHALRRRFAFLHLPPNYDLLRRWHAAHGGPDVTVLVAVLEEINQDIGDPDFALGFTPFLTETLEDSLPLIWRSEIEPYLEEIFFNRREMLTQIRWDTIRRRLEGSQP